MSDEITIEEEYDDDNELDNDSQILEEQIAVENIKPSHKLDYTLQTPEERNELVKKIVAETPSNQLTPRYLEILSDYIIFAMDKKEKQERKILTSSRMVTLNKHETSFEGLCASFENGEDGIYNILSDLGKQTILCPKKIITQDEIDSIPALKELHEAIEDVKEEYKTATGKRKFLLKKQMIAMYQDQYVIRNENRGKWFGASRSGSKFTKCLIKTPFNDHFAFDENGEPSNDTLISFFNPSHIEALLCNYSGLKEVAYGDFRNDLYYLMEDLDNLIEHTLQDYPLYKELVIYKIDGKQNIEIQQLLEEHFGIKHSVEYISSLWRNKIPKMIAEKAKEEYLLWYYNTQERGKWKKCSRCGQIKLAHNRFYSKNKTSKDGFYSICKCCRNQKTKELRTK